MKRSFEKFTKRLESFELLKGVEKRISSHHVSLKELYEGPRVPSTVAARRAVYAWLMNQNKGINEIARLFDRAPSGIFKMTRERA